MSSEYPLKISVSQKGEKLPLKFTEEATACVKDLPRVECELLNNEIILKGMWEPDLDAAIDKIRHTLGVELNLSKPVIEYIEGDTFQEPVIEISIYSPENYMGDVMGDLNRRRGLIGGMDDTSLGKKIVACVPIAEMFGYIKYLNSLAQIDWKIEVKFHGYQPCPNPGGPDPNEPASQALRA